MSGRMGWVNNHVVARLEVAAIPVDTVLWRAIYLSFFRRVAENPNLDPRGKVSWEVFASAYTAAIAPRILFTCLRVGLPKILCSIFASNFCTDVSRHVELVRSEERRVLHG